MKKVFLFLGVSAFVLASCVGNPEGKKAETTDGVEVAEISGTELVVNAAESTVEWTGKKVSGQHHGTVDITSGALVVEGDQLIGGQFVIDLNTINDLDMEGEFKEKLEAHLKSDDFFDVANHPEAKFEITGVTPSSEEGVLVVSGNLTIRGVTKNITFDAHVAELSETSANVKADFNIAREDWGVNYAGQADDLISKEINFKINLVAGS
ncbi:MAG TPA: YceI family protein, partial [Sphingobacteriaceae bacterium]|nr:YceI family protein [Sphingobacteriaceae bacterium]